jgi:N-acetylglucosamine kinase-like BadF-type ATPase
MTTAKLSLGIDGGASSAKWCLINQDSRVIKEGSLPPIDGHLYRADSLERFRNFLTAVQAQLDSNTPNSVVIGITGFGAPDQIKAEILKAFPTVDIKMSSDIALAYLSEFNPGEGIYLYAGTGSVAIHLTKDNKEISVGGWGYLLGDEGAGYWIGREALRHLLLQIESSQQLDLLSKRVSEHLGGTNWAAVRSYVYGQDRSAIAALSPIVSQCALNSDSIALSIIDAAANHLHELILRLRNLIKDQTIPIAFGGGLSESLLSDVLEKKLGEIIEISRKNHAFAAAKLGL